MALVRTRNRHHVPNFWQCLDVVEADVTVSSVVVEADFDAVTADIIVESFALVSIGVI